MTSNQDGVSTLDSEEIQSCMKISNSAIQTEVRERRVEEGSFSKIKSVHVFCYFETFPIWLLLFDAFSCETLTICRYSNLNHFQEQCILRSGCTKEFIAGVVQEVGTERFRFVIDPIDEFRQLIPKKVVVVSGSISFFVNLLTELGDVSCVFILDRPFCQRLRQGRPSGVPSGVVVKWHRIPHTALGGPTNYVTLLGIQGLGVHVPLSTLRRCIRDVFQSNTAARPIEATKEESSRDRATYLLSDVLKVDQLQAMVYHPSHLTRTGWAKRRLSIEEVGAAYGYPRQHYQRLEWWLFNHSPYQTLLPIFQAVVGSEPRVKLQSTSAESVTLPMVEGNALDDDNRESGGFWFAAINRWLPDSWTGSAPQHSSKSDDAAIPVHLWDSRILLLFPEASALLPLLRKLCLRRFRRNVMRDFIA